MGDFFYHLLQRNSLLPSVCNHFEYLSNVFFYSFAWHSNIMKADMEPTNTYRCLPDKAKPENVPMFDREDPACGKLSVWVTLSGSVSKKGDTGRAAFTTFLPEEQPQLEHQEISQHSVLTKPIQAHVPCLFWRAVLLGLMQCVVW